MEGGVFRYIVLFGSSLGLISVTALQGLVPIFYFNGVVGLCLNKYPIGFICIF